VLVIVTIAFDNFLDEIYAVPCTLYVVVGIKMSNEFDFARVSFSIKRSGTFVSKE
jgi:hypothetical protein